MNQLIKDKWIEALLSENYIQTVSCLKDEKGYCCLGVLTDIYINEVGSISWDYKEDHSGLWYYSADNESAVLPLEVATWAGLDSTDPFYEDGDDVKYLSRHNDNDGMTFEDIAKVIKTNF